MNSYYCMFHSLCLNIEDKFLRKGSTQFNNLNIQKYYKKRKKDVGENRKSNFHLTKESILTCTEDIK